jgi:hypothetical protein
LITTVTKLLNAVAASVVTGATFALGAVDSVVNWSIEFTEDPDSFEINLESSDDNEIWSVIDTTTVTGSRTVSVSAPFIRARVVSIDNGDVVGNLLTVRAAARGNQVSTSDYVIGPSSSVDSAVALFNGASGKLLKELLISTGAFDAIPFVTFSGTSPARVATLKVYDASLDDIVTLLESDPY